MRSCSRLYEDSSVAIVVSSSGNGYYTTLTKENDDAGVVRKGVYIPEKRTSVEVKEIHNRTLTRSHAIPNINLFGQCCGITSTTR
jgi:hypothetical protein